MAHNQPGQTEENMKILKELEEQKKKLKAQQPSPGIPTQTASRPLVLEQSSPMSAAMASRHAYNRQALHEATVTSFGSFMVTDSQYGNPIIAVLPRFEDKKSPTSPK